MIRAEFLPSALGGAAGEVFGFGEFSFAGEVAGEIVAGVEGFEMIGAAEFLGDPKDFAIFGFGSGVAALVEQRVSEAAMASHRKSVIGAERFGLKVDQVPEHGFGIDVGIVCHERVGQTVSIQERVRMLRTKDAFFESYYFAILGGGIGMFALRLQSIRQP